MNISNLFTDDDAVSPVIGVILMVAITVILAAVIGAFVLNIGGSQESAPQATIDFTEHTINSQTVVEIAHQSGAPLPKEEVNVQVGTGFDEDLDSKLTAGTSVWVYYNDDATNALTQGSSKPVSGDVGSTSVSSEVRLVWSSPSSDKSSIIASFNPS